MRGADRDYWDRYESLVDEQIRRATEAGAFDDLPGAGRPLALGPDDDDWWVRAKLRREGVSSDALLPPPLRLRKEVEDLPATVADLATERAVRAVVDDLDRRIVAFLRTPTGPRVPVRRVDADAVVARWRAERPAAPPPTPTPPARPDTGRPWWRRRRAR